MSAPPAEALPRPVRRSPLDHIHASLGAHWRAAGVRWPESYGDPAAEARTIEGAVGLAELGPADKLMARGVRTREGLDAMGLEYAVGRVTRSGSVEAWALGADEALLVFHDATAQGSSATDASTRMREAGTTITDLSSGLAVLRLVGPSARSVLQEVCPVDVSDLALADQRIIQAPMANIRVMIARQDSPTRPGFTLLVARDEAEYLWEVLSWIGAPYGIRPVGGAAAR